MYESKEEAIDVDKRLRAAYMGHQKWVIVNNETTNFDQKIKNAKEKAHFILGHNNIASSSFYKKFLLIKSGVSGPSSQVPIILAKSQYWEESYITEIFLQVLDSSFLGKDGRKVVAASIEKKGNNKAYTYTHKLELEVAGQQM